MTNTYSRRPNRLRDPGDALSPDQRDSLRAFTIAQGVQRAARHLGVPDRALLGAIAGIPNKTTQLVVVRIAERGLP